MGPQPVRSKQIESTTTGGGQGPQLRSTYVASILTKDLFERMAEGEKERAIEIVLGIKRSLLLSPSEYRFAHCFVRYWKQKREESTLARNPQMKTLTEQDGLPQVTYNQLAGCTVTSKDLADLNETKRDRIIRAQNEESITLAGSKEVDKWLSRRMLRQLLTKRPDPPLKLEDLEQIYDNSEPDGKLELKELKAV
jgi:hypothetical protein